MNFIQKNPKQVLNKGFLKQKILRKDIELFKTNLSILLSKVNLNESEENQKNHIRDFLKGTYYNQTNEINTKDNIDLVIHLGETNNSKVGVIIETKRPSNKQEMFSAEYPYTKAIAEIILYYFNERYKYDNNELKNLIITNVHKWYIFDANDFDKIIYRNTKIKQLYNTYINDNKDTAFFYEEVIKILKASNSDLNYTYFDIGSFSNINNSEDKNLIALFKILSSHHLLKEPFADDSNSLNSGFYKELLHIIGLEESKESGKIVIQRKQNNRNSGSLIENTINILETEGFDQVDDLNSYGSTQEEQLFNISLEIVITWINRILFLKLLESQLVCYHNGDRSYRFLNKETINDFDEMYKLFHQVLAKVTTERRENIREKFKKVPYLNSSLFEISEIEKHGICINTLDDSEKLEFFSGTILSEDRRHSNSIYTIDYLFKFLDAYDFAGDSTEDIAEDSKLLINSSVLGKVFEKINGYKDGSIFTPGFITMYMCSQSIRLAVMQKFRDKYNWKIENFEDIRNYIIDRKTTNDILEFNSLINSLRICDPAVGSGHFLVSALNEIIAIKSELGILADSNGKRLNFDIIIENDELIITNDSGDIFEYKIINGRPKNPEIQKLQKTLFQEKQTIIENCLFGVDINPKSVIICRLRLWIELLKNAYYKDDTNFQDLETLPNIDINIKCGNSLVSRFQLDDTSPITKADANIIQLYKEAVQEYKNINNAAHKITIRNKIKNYKSQLKGLINTKSVNVIKLIDLKESLNSLISQTDLFNAIKSKKEEQEFTKKVSSLTQQIQKLESEIEFSNNNPVFDNAFEWRFEFPEILDSNGNFVGFDIVIGNPPYIQLQKDGGNLAKQFEKMNYQTLVKTGDIYALFYEKGINLLNNNGYLIFITSNKWMRAGYGEKLRDFFTKYDSKILIDLGPGVFESATVDTNILLIKKNKNTNNLRAVTINSNSKNYIDIYSILKNDGVIINKLSKDAWTISGDIEMRIKEKIERIGTPLKEWDIKINYGIKTGFNEAFIIDGKKKDELIAQDAKSAEIIKPILRGRDIKRYKAEFADLWLINSHNGIKEKNIPRIDIPKNYPAIYEHLKKYEKELIKRQDKGDHWTNLRNCAYIEEFEKEKIVYPNMASNLCSFYDINRFLTNQKCFIITSIHENLKILNLFFNSNSINYFFKKYCSATLGSQGFEMSKIFIETLPIPKISPEKQQPFIDLVNKILKKKENNKDATAEEREIDMLVYKLYELTDEEVKLIEGKK